MDFLSVTMSIPTHCHVISPDQPPSEHGRQFRLHHPEAVTKPLCHPDHGEEPLRVLLGQTEAGLGAELNALWCLAAEVALGKIWFDFVAVNSSIIKF